MKKRLLLILPILGLFNLAFAQQAVSVKGKVMSQGEPVAYAVVVIEQLKSGTGTDSLGYYALSNLPEGTYQLKVTCLGYIARSRSVQVVAGQTQTVNFNLQPDEQQMEEVVVTGTMKEVKKADSPIPVEVYSAAYFKKNTSPSLFENLQIVNGVQPQLNCNVCNTGDIHINGMEGPYTMITIDGMPIVSSLSTVYGLSGIPNGVVQRIEVVKGPASTLYGSEAVGGLINVITKEPEVMPRFFADIYSTSLWEVNTDLAVKAKVGKASSLLSVNYFNYNNKTDINKDNFTDVTLQNRISVFNKWNFHRKDNRKAGIAARYVYEDRWGGELQWNRSFRGGDSVYGESIFTKRFELIGNYQLPVREKLNLQYSLTTHHQNSVYGTTTYMGQQDILFGQLLWTRKAGKRHDLLAGLPFRYTFYDDNTPGTASGDSVHTANRPSRVYLPGLFVQDEFALTEKSLLLSGLRMDYSSDHGLVFSPRFSYKYNYNPSNIFRITTGNGFRVVNLFTEDHAALTGSRKVELTEDLKPERSYNVNLNYQKYISHSSGFIELDGSVFYTYFTNKIIGDFTTDPDKILYDNLNGYAISKGITLNTSWSWKFPLKVIAGFTFMDVYSIEKDEKGIKSKVQQLNAPDFSGTYAVTYKIERLGLVIDYTGRVMGPMLLPVQENDFRPSKSPWFSLQNIQLTKRIGKLEVYGGIKNLLNFMPKHPLMRPFDPFDKYVDDPVSNPQRYTFDTSYNYAPVQGIKGFMGVRLSY